MNEREKERYGRQILLFGEEGQERLKGARVLIAGAGGLGCPVAIYLAAAGIGSITLVDNDRVELSNLNRQVLHWDRDIGRMKSTSAGEKIRELNPDITVKALDDTITGENVLGLAAGADAIVDAMDNYETRFLLNRAALGRGIPLFHGAIHGFYGQAMTIVPGRTACLRCIIPRVPEKEVFPVIGVTPGVIGTVQANEVIKFFLGKGDLLENRLLLWDGLLGRFDEIPVERDPRCRDCGTGQGEGP